MTPEARHRRRIRGPILAITALAWAAIVAAHATSSRPAHDTAFMAHASGSPPMAGMEQDPVHASAGSLVAFPAGWPLMLAAMMLPLLTPALRHAYARSLPRRRWRALTLLVAAYAGTWSVGGLILQALATALQAAFPRGGVASVIAVAVVWQLSPMKQRCLNRHHAYTAISAFGRAADIDALCLGCRQALWCFGSCWTLMLLPLVFGEWHLATMAVVALWVWAEALNPAVAPAWRIRLPVRAARITAATIRRLRGSAATTRTRPPDPRRTHEHSARPRVNTIRRREGAPR